MEKLIIENLGEHGIVFAITFVFGALKVIMVSKLFNAHLSVSEALIRIFVSKTKAFDNEKIHIIFKLIQVLELIFTHLCCIWQTWFWFMLIVSRK